MPAGAVGGPCPSTGHRTIRELIAVRAELDRLAAESVGNASGDVIPALTPEEEQRLADHASLIAACAARCDQMLARRAWAKHKANPTLQALETFVYRAEQVLFHRWIVERFKLTHRDIKRIDIAQQYQEHRFKQQQHHQREDTGGSYWKPWGTGRAVVELQAAV